MEAPKSPQWQVTVDGVDSIYDPWVDLTLGRMRQIKQWYPDIGTVRAFNTAFLNGDPDAMACVLWIIALKAVRPGQPNPPDPRQMADFQVGSVVASTNLTPDLQHDADPTPPAMEATSGQSPDSTLT